jgi:hypothetical protein
MQPRPMFLIVSVVIASAFSTGCPESTAKKTEPVKTCTSAGVPCVFEEGKLGLCVAKTEPCNGAPCYTCQSQH